MTTQIVETRKTRDYGWLILLIILVGGLSWFAWNYGDGLVAFAQSKMALPVATEAVTEEPAIEPVATEAVTEEPAIEAPNTDQGFQAEQPKAETYSYIPGGEGTGAFASDVVFTPDQLGPYDKASTAFVADGNCGRFWQATNGENLVWVPIFCNIYASEGVGFQWTHAFEATITDGTVSFDLYRDQYASETVKAEPYKTANQKNSEYGLGWFFQGHGRVCIGDGEATTCRELDGTGVYQIAFPYDMPGFYHIDIEVAQGQDLHMWLGEILTPNDNWLMPASAYPATVEPVATPTQDPYPAP